VPSPTVDARHLATVLTTYRARYQRSQAEAEAAIRRLAIPATAARAAAGTPAYTRLFVGTNDEDPEVTRAAGP